MFLPTDEAPTTAIPSNGDDDDGAMLRRQEDQQGEVEEPSPNPEPVVTPSGSYITSEGIKSTFDVTQAMLSDANFERLEHITVRVWIDHERRGDVEAEITSPNGVTSVLARTRRFDEATSGFPGWKFMSVKHWYVVTYDVEEPHADDARDENPVGTWTITVKDAVNPDKNGRFVAWSLQLWGESIDPALARDWAPAEQGEPDEEQTGSDPSTVISQKPKPTDHLPEDHASATGESHLPGLATTTAADTVEPTDMPSDENDELGEPGFLGGVGDLASNSTWLASAGGIIILFGLGAGVFLLLRRRNRRRNLFGLANEGQGGARGDYAPVSDDVPMGLLERGRRKLGGGRGGAGAAGTKELYDAFGDGPSDESDPEDDDERLNESTALRYHDDFLEDDGDGDGNVRRSRDARASPGYVVEEEEEDGQPEREDRRPGGSGQAAQGSNSGSSGSWQDAAEDART